MSNWFATHHQEWIAETLRVFGFINREHLERKFGISTRANPGTMIYNQTAKKYEAKEK